jgi:uncharacterized membrane protein YdjX (TVP38/TMEM64 family)
MVNGGEAAAMLHDPASPPRAMAKGMTERSTPLSRRSTVVTRFVPIAVLLLGLGLFFAFGLGDYLGCGSLRDNRAWLLDWVNGHRPLAIAAFMTIYAGAVALSVPSGAALTVAAGFLFGALMATGMIAVAGTVGATLLFLAARSAFHDLLQARAGPWLLRLERGFAENELSYLLFLRLVPLFPFFVVNLVPAFLGVRLRSFVVATFFGIIPGSFVFASVGAGLGSLFDAGRDCSLENVLTPEIVIALVGLAVLALLPVAYKRFFAARQP